MSTTSTPLISLILHRFHALATTFLLYILSLGPMPQHVGFVMDGNRRYARRKNKKTAEGHSDGFQSLRRVLEVCLKLKIRNVTVYAFAIDNFTRERDEVDALMDLARRKLLELCQHGDLLHQHGIRVKFVGRTELFPTEVREAVVEMERLTANNTNGILNVASPYSSRDEITTAIKDTAQEIYDGRLPSRGVTETHIFNNLATSRAITDVSYSEFGSRDIVKGGKLDILVRTSNVKRLSDFMMWQASEDTQLHFVRTMWPEFGLTDMLPILLGWQQKMFLKRFGVIRN